MRILVTGGSGRIGYYVLHELLSAGHEVSSFARSEPVVEGVRFVRGDITDIERMKKVCPGYHAIVHLAAVAAPRLGTPEHLMQVNVMGTLNVLEAAVQAGVGKVVFASSGAATGFSFQKYQIVPKYLPLDEKHPPAPQDTYGLSKLLSELTLKRYTEYYGIQTISLRINNNWFLDRRSAGEAIKIGAFRYESIEELWSQRYLTNVTDPDEWPLAGVPSPRQLLWAVTDARDCAQSFRLALENDRIEHEVFQINASDTSSLLETSELIARHYPSVRLKANLEGYASLVSHEKATRLLGYRPQCTWRQSDFKTWMDGQVSS